MYSKKEKSLQTAMSLLLVQRAESDKAHLKKTKPSVLRIRVTSQALENLQGTSCEGGVPPPTAAVSLVAEGDIL